jgi:hypothetical protein
MRFEILKKISLAHHPATRPIQRGAQCERLSARTIALVLAAAALIAAGCQPAPSTANSIGAQAAAIEISCNVPMTGTQADMDAWLKSTSTDCLKRVVKLFDDQQGFISSCEARGAKRECMEAIMASTRMYRAMFRDESLKGGSASDTSSSHEGDDRSADYCEIYKCR